MSRQYLLSRQKSCLGRPTRGGFDLRQPAYNEALSFPMRRPMRSSGLIHINGIGFRRPIFYSIIRCFERNAQDSP